VEVEYLACRVGRGDLDEVRPRVGRAEGNCFGDRKRNESDIVAEMALRNGLAAYLSQNSAYCAKHVHTQAPLNHFLLTGRERRAALCSRGEGIARSATGKQSLRRKVLQHALMSMSRR